MILGATTKTTGRAEIFFGIGEDAVQKAEELQYQWKALLPSKTLGWLIKTHSFPRKMWERVSCFVVCCFVASTWALCMLGVHHKLIVSSVLIHV